MAKRTSKKPEISAASAAAFKAHATRLAANPNANQMAALRATVTRLNNRAKTYRKASRKAELVAQVKGLTARINKLAKAAKA